MSCQVVVARLVCCRDLSRLRHIACDCCRKDMLVLHLTDLSSSTTGSSVLSDGVGDVQNGVCRALHCGSSTFEMDLPVCDPADTVAQTVLTAVDTSEQAAPGFGTKLDADSDGCVEPYQASDGLCLEADASGDTAPAIQMRVRFRRHV